VIQVRVRAARTLGELIPRKGMRLGEALKISIQMSDALAAPPLPRA
jgi:hypothetical protein